MKRLTALILSALIIFSIFPEAVSANDAGEEPDKLIALTFDDGPGAYTEHLLDELDARGVRVTFFMVGRNTTGIFKDLPARELKAGHQLASHSYKHAWLTRYSAGGMKSDLDKTVSAISEAAGGRYKYWLRPPYGAKNNTLLKTAGVPVVMWSVDPYDWKYRDSEVVSDAVISKAKDGDIILLHDIHQTSVEAALIIIDELQKKGFEFVTVTELARRKGQKAEDGTSYSFFRGETIAPRVMEPLVSVSPLPGSGSYAYRVIASEQNGAPVYVSCDGSDPGLCPKTGAVKFSVPADCVLRVIAAYDVNGDRSSEIRIDLHSEDMLK